MVCFLLIDSYQQFPFPHQLDASSCPSSASSLFSSGKNRSIRFHVSTQSFSFDGSVVGGTRYLLVAINRMTFFRFSRTASSYIPRGNVLAQTPLEQITSGLTRLSPWPLFIKRSRISTIRSHKSSIPSHAESRTRYWRNTLQSKDATCTLISPIPSRSERKTSGFRRFKINGNRTSVKMAVHSL